MSNLIDIGFGNLICPERILCVLNFDSAPVKKLVHLAKENNKLIDATCGRKTVSVLIFDSDHVVLSYLSSDKINLKFNESKTLKE